MNVYMQEHRQLASEKSIVTPNISILGCELQTLIKINEIIF